MEKYSKFNDKLYGINPFLPPKYKKITFKMILIAILRLPIFLLYKIHYKAIKWLIKIESVGEINPKHLIYCNKVSCFDKSIIRFVYGINNFKRKGIITQVIFPEEICTNNKGVLQYIGEKSDYVIGLKYTNECIFMPYINDWKEKLKWLIRFLGNNNKVSVNCIKSFDLKKVTNLPQLSLNKTDYNNFLIEFNKKL